MIGRAKVGVHSIELQDNTPIKQKFRPLNSAQLEVVRENVKELEERALIRRSNSAWAYPLVLIKKKDGKERMCVEYRLLNNRTLKDAYPLPRVSDILDCLSGAKYFSALDLKAGYWKVPIDQLFKNRFSYTSWSV